MQPVRDTLGLLQNQRHRFINHLQVLSGWQQLGDLARAGRYLAKVVAELQVEGQLGRLEPPELALALIQAHWAAQDQDVQVEWQVGSQLARPLNPGQCAELGAVLVLAVEQVARAGPRKLRVSLSWEPAGWLLALAGSGLTAGGDLAVPIARLAAAGVRVQLADLPAQGS